MARSEEPGPFDRGTPDTAVGRLEAKMADDERWVPEEDRPAYRAAMRDTMAYRGAVAHDAIATFGRELGSAFVTVLQETLGMIRHPRRLLEVDWLDVLPWLLVVVGIWTEVIVLAIVLSGHGS